MFEDQKHPTRRQALKTIAASGLGAALAGTIAPAAFAQDRTFKASAFGNHRALENSIIVGGNVFSILADQKSTGGMYTLIDAIVKQGREAPPHTHTREDEIFYILDGEVEFTSGGIVTLAKPGDHVFQPRGAQHWFKLKSPTARALVMFTPGGLEGLYRRMGAPAKSLELPEAAPTAPTPAQFEGLVKLAASYGVMYALPQMK
jgi:quercetin dioxygenase-like cupin family protein